MRRVVALGVALIALVSVGLIYSKLAQARRETAYRAAVEPYQRDLPVGMPRADVEKYLASRHVEYHAASYREGYTTYELKIGRTQAISSVRCGRSTSHWSSILPISWRKFRHKED